MSHLKNLILVCAALLLTLSISTASAAEFKMGYVNLERVLTESAAGKKAKTDIEEFYDKRQADLDLAQEDFNKLQREFNDAKHILNQDALERRQEDLRRRRVTMKRQIEDAERDFEAYESRVFRRLKEDIFQVITALGGKDGYSIIFNRSEGLVLYVNPQFEITEAVIKAYDAQFAAGATSKQ